MVIEITHKIIYVFIDTIHKSDQSSRQNNRKSNKCLQSFAKQYKEDFPVQLIYLYSACYCTNTSHIHPEQRNKSQAKH